MKRLYKPSDHTFVICAYQESPYLDECVKSVLNQKVRSTVRIATSTPNNHINEIAGKYGIPVCINQNQKGIASDWNYAVDCADTPLVTLAHQDDVYEYDYTDRILRALSQCRNPIIAFTGYSELRGSMVVKRSALLAVKRLMLAPMRFGIFWGSRFVRRRILSMGNAICCPTVTLVKDSVPLPLFKNNMKSNIDWQAWEELSRLRGEFAYVPQDLVKHRLHELSTTAGLLEVNGRQEEDLYMFRKFWPEPAAKIIDWFYRSNERSNKLK